MSLERNTHHFLFERHDYRQKPYAQLRQLVVAKNVLVVKHNELHANIGPPPKPDRPLAYNLLNYLESERATQPFDEAFLCIDYLMKVANPDSLALAEHLSEQIGYLI